ncbi:MAG: hypothetical protein U5R06_22510 [candidate division KSB1 bacterium]|nr:hypothetical protein [candidate division KSB1 bacterium]
MTNEKETKKDKSFHLDLQGYITSEYDFAQKTAEHLMVEQQKLVNIYIILNAALYAAIFFIYQIILSSQAFSNTTSKSIIYTILTLLFFIGVINILKLSRLRRVWWNCNHIMNKIKDVYTQQLDSSENIFLWTQDAIKHTFQEKYDSIYFLSALVVMVLDSFALGFAILYAEFSFLFAVIAVFVLLISQILYYRAN